MEYEDLTISELKLLDKRLLVYEQELRRDEQKCQEQIFITQSKRAKIQRRLKELKEVKK